MPQSKKLVKSIASRKGKFGSGKLVEEAEAIIYAQDTEGRNYALTRTATGYPGIEFLQTGEFERLKSEGVNEISLKKALKIQDAFLVARKKSLA